MRWHVTTFGGARPLVGSIKGATLGAGVFGCVLALLTASVAIGTRLPTFGFLHGLPGLHQLDYGADPTGTLPRLTREFLLEALGESTLERLVPSEPSVPPRASADQSPGEAPPPEPGPRGSAGGILAGDWELRPRMEASESSVAPGEVVEYTVTVGNVGTEPFRGEFVITSHIPFGTTDATPSPCGDAGVDPDPGHPCVHPSAPVPGSPNEDVHQVTFSVGFAGAGLGPDEDYVASFRVRINPGTSSGTMFLNHAHLDVVGDSEGPVRTNDVVVSVE